MTRQEAIDNLMGAWWQRDMEFCVGASESAASRAELVESLRALGVTDEEMGEDDGSTRR
jgi:hypothetical protein